MPHGGVGTSASVTMTRASNSLIPRATAAPTATRSAHEPAGYDAFSTLHPSTTIPFDASSAAPTRNREYGAYACSIAASARVRRDRQTSAVGPPPSSLNVRAPVPEGTRSLALETRR